MKSSTKTASKPAPRYRPLGVSIAILATAALYCLLPIFPVLLLVIVILRRPSDISDLAGQFIGGPLGWVSALIGIITLVVCVFAWIGRPARSRWTLIGLVWLATALRLIQTAQALSVHSGIGTVGGSGDAVTRSIALCQLPMLIIVPLYITWYMNRAPARAFYG
ncbi:MAG: hypothetical protein IT324_11565 [Anaerolineae bacterium]|nr:hypothetical protein [Anaerolineae bacterium]